MAACSYVPWLREKKEKKRRKSISCVVAVLRLSGERIQLRVSTRRRICQTSARMLTPRCRLPKTASTQNSVKKSPPTGFKPPSSIPGPLTETLQTPPAVSQGHGPLLKTHPLNSQLQPKQQRFHAPPFNALDSWFPPAAATPSP